MPGITLTVQMGEKRPQPVPMLLTEALHSVEVTYSDDSRSGFQLVFQIGRSGKQDLQDYKLINHPLLKVFNRVVLIVTVNATARVLMDGIIMNQQFSPSAEPGQSTLTLTGEDVSVMMDRKKNPLDHPAQDEATIVRMVVANYSEYGLTPDITPPRTKGAPTKSERVPVQTETDLKYLESLAKRYGYVFYIVPGPKVGENTAYWGPPPRSPRPFQTVSIQKPITLHMGSFSNTNSINVQFDAQGATQIKGRFKDPKTGRTQPINVRASDRPRLAKQSALDTQKSQGIQQVQTFAETEFDPSRARDRAQGIVNQAGDDAVTVTGELDTVQYGDLLQLRGLVGLRGVGYNHDGIYYVKKVTHRIQRGEYKQSFTITREGLGTTITALRR